MPQLASKDQRCADPAQTCINIALETSLGRAGPECVHFIAKRAQTSRNVNWKTSLGQGLSSNILLQKRTQTCMSINWKTSLLPCSCEHNVHFILFSPSLSSLSPLPFHNSLYFTVSSYCKRSLHQSNSTSKNALGPSAVYFDQWTNRIGGKRTRGPGEQRPREPTQDFLEPCSYSF